MEKFCRFFTGKQINQPHFIIGFKFLVKGRLRILDFALGHISSWIISLTTLMCPATSKTGSFQQNIFLVPRAIFRNLTLIIDSPFPVVSRFLKKSLVKKQLRKKNGKRNSKTFFGQKMRLLEWFCILSMTFSWSFNVFLMSLYTYYSAV